ncbi:hypothetical protein HK099_003235 [Clydaea vesicula]|uniref:Major facilitator superfamily (MFS) profile domain-containing protein n=1 Tax=Clydaea vesicula TaxID=447962 RepID=A0AAD5XWF2_9FUNG|nr:hypothetical protein HK099_003235 [Clydaea vesicula]
MNEKFLQKKDEIISIDITEEADFVDSNLSTSNLECKFIDSNTAQPVPLADLTFASYQTVAKHDVNYIVVEQDLPSSWLIVLGSFLTHFFVMGFFFSFGTFQQHYVKIGIGNSSTVAFIGSIGPAVIVLSGIFSGHVADQIGYCTSIKIGATFLGTGLILASFSKEFWKLVITQGILLGIGGGLCFFPSSSAPSFWFVKYRGFATGLAASGTGFGGFMYGIVIEKMLNSNLSLEWTLRILGLLIFGSSFGFFIPVFYIPFYVTEHLSLKPEDGALAVAIYNASSSIGRIFMGLIADLGPGYAWSYLSCFSLHGLSILLIFIPASQYSVLILFSVIGGFLSGGIISLVPTVIAQLFGMNSLASIVALFSTSNFLGNLLGTPLAGLILETSKFNGKINWTSALSVGGGLELFGTTFGFLALYLVKKRKEKKTVVYPVKEKEEEKVFKTINRVNKSNFYD